MPPSTELIKQMQDDIQSRLKKIEGQIRGLQGMIAADKECEQILTQARAAQSALKAVCNLILKAGTGTGTKDFFRVICQTLP